MEQRDVEDAVPYKGRGTEHLICHPPYGDLIRRFAPPVHLAVPEKPFGLTLILRLFDRCGNTGFASSASGSAKPAFPVRGEGLREE